MLPILLLSTGVGCDFFLSIFFCRAGGFAPGPCFFSGELGVLLPARVFLLGGEDFFGLRFFSQSGSGACRDRGRGTFR